MVLKPIEDSVKIPRSSQEMDEFMVLPTGHQLIRDARSRRSKMNNGRPTTARELFGDQGSAQPDNSLLTPDGESATSEKTPKEPVSDKPDRVDMKKLMPQLSLDELARQSHQVQIEEGNRVRAFVADAVGNVDGLKIGDKNDDKR